MTERFTFKKEERLCNKTELDRLFQEGQSTFVFPFRYLFNLSKSPQQYPVKVVFSVPKKSFKQAVKRNLIRRRMKEVYRLNKHSIYQDLEERGMQLSLMIIFVDKEIPSYQKVEKSLKKGLNKVMKVLAV